mgnify:CR=1 FL=1
MIAASADMGRFMTWLPFLRSTMKTWGWPDEPSQTLTKASDSMAQDCVRGGSRDGFVAALSSRVA